MKKSSFCRNISSGAIRFPSAIFFSAAFFPAIFFFAVIFSAMFLSAATVFPAFAAAQGIGPGFEEEIEDTSGRPQSPLDIKYKNKEEIAAKTETAAKAETAAKTKTGAKAETSAKAETAESADTTASDTSKKEESPSETEAVTAGESYGSFRISGYCGCELCCGGQTLTYSGVLPAANHTISADLERFPLGTRLLIDGTVYTVEDMGSGVSGDRLDIYFNTHEEALDYGLKDVEVFAVSEKN